MSDLPYKPQKSERQIQAYWQENSTFEVSENSDKPKFYCLAMFPYPSGQLHMGHVRTYTLGDVIARFQRLQGKNVLHPMGWDAFGLPAENAAIKHDIPPAKWTHSNIAHMKDQLQSLGFSYDWSREFATCNADYYRWEQWFFTKMFKKGLVYKKAAMVNWDPVDQTVLANEQVINGRGWRSDALVERRELAQWFLKITDYAQELLDNLDGLDGWPDKIKTMQRNWIGRSTGVEMTFPLPQIDDVDLDGVTVYTTRPDTLMGATYLAVAPQHPLAKTAAAKNPVLAEFLTQCNQVKVAEADMAKMEKLGMDTGYIAAHPLTGEAIPVWVANFVLMEYGSGAVMSVPAHDQRDYEFAKKYGLPIKQVVAPAADSEQDCDIAEAAYVSKNGVLTNSGDFDGLNFDEAFKQIAEALGDKNLGETQVNYRIRDWGVSRQRYWGCPIPIINCEKCGAVAVPEDQLPVTLPTDVQFDGIGSPIKKMESFYKTTCPTCDGAAERETDTFDTFMESSWYYARFASANNENEMLDERAKYWTSVDHYVGGEEHAILHLLYARFFHKVMRDEGLVDTDEPFEKLLALGMVLKDGVKMSKSAGDAGDPKLLLDAYGADAVRMAMMFAAPPEQSFEWSEHGVESANRWLRTKLFKTVDQHLARGTVEALNKNQLNDSQKDTRRVLHETIAKAADDYGRRLSFNTVVSSSMSLMNHLLKTDDRTPQGRAVAQEVLTAVVTIMAPITPHICHELLLRLTGEKLEEIVWLDVDEDALVKTTVPIIVQVNGKLRGKLEMSVDDSKQDIEAAARKVENVEKFIEGKTIRKVIVVPAKLINFVVS
ncbi:MAG: leucine--tRNA ligase [Pseudomonadales bacterium]|jgi:leucyl-tRNA synthetase|tara:strand:+ start:16831 stop:19308 length:2478 start_codon:yes stop_codon:yes gene_type:complete